MKRLYSHREYMFIVTKKEKKTHTTNILRSAVEPALGHFPFATKRPCVIFIDIHYIYQILGLPL